MLSSKGKAPAASHQLPANRPDAYDGPKMMPWLRRLEELKAPRAGQAAPASTAPMDVHPSIAAVISQPPAAAAGGSAHSSTAAAATAPALPSSPPKSVASSAAPSPAASAGLPSGAGPSTSSSGHRGAALAAAAAAAHAAARRDSASSAAAPPAALQQDGIGERRLGVALAAEAAATKRRKRTQYTMMRRRSMPVLQLSASSLQDKVSFTMQQVADVFGATRGLPADEAITLREQLLAALPISEGGAPAGSARAYVDQVAARLEADLGARLPSQQAAAQPGGGGGPPPHGVWLMIGECDKVDKDMRCGGSEVKTIKVKDALFEVHGLDKSMANTVFLNLNDSCVYEMGTTSCLTSHRSDFQADRLMCRLFLDIGLIMLKNRIHQLAGLAAMGKTVGLELLVGRLWRAPFHLFCAPGAPAVQLAHFAESARKGGWDTEEAIERQLGWAHGLGAISLALNPGVELASAEERVNLFRVKMGLSQVERFPTVAEEEAALKECVRCGATTYGAPPSTRRITDELAVATVAGKQYLMCYTHHSRYCHYTSRDGMTQAAALKRALTEDEDELASRRRGVAAPPGTCPMCDAPKANRSLKSCGLPSILTCHACYTRVRSWLKKGL